jgi:hypothetical protein
MKRTASISCAALFVAVLFVAAIAGAQDNANSAANASDSQTENNQKLELRTVEGCLSKTASTYVITGGGPGPKQFRIVDGDTSMLKGKIGQTVRVVGMVGQSDPVAVASPPFNEGSTTGAGYETIVARKIKIIGGLCSHPGQEWKGDHE